MTTAKANTPKVTGPVDAHPPLALTLQDVDAWYGDSKVLHGISLQVRQGEVVTLLGRNGAGRTTTLRAIMALTGRVRGHVRIFGKPTAGLPPHRIAHLGVGYCPEERGIFSALSTRENLQLLPRVGASAMGDQALYAMFPNLLERADSPAGKLSGGEQQMLALARILRAGASLLLLDEITEGLAPVIVDRLAEVIRALRSSGFTIVLVEQNLNFSEGLADRHYILESGRIVDQIEAAEISTKRAAIDRLLSV
ncbi:ABC transporter ATP-binding protein [Cupriavidus sp. D39]|uniref:ABC transporter ATP-binding protein n=1 Tax=Cupriavidus sp. D39 TaxID=2997877 RepID=UPI00226FA308|nr:ABC transporter ATP-binding protein [Cupriavidus sp. D39]MCY0854678.1 ABC transporter ATP-binding protein [Cupriavidus sp. D39]